MIGSLYVTALTRCNAGSWTGGDLKAPKESMY
jgi:hypothetical protein